VTQNKSPRMADGGCEHGFCSLPEQETCVTELLTKLGETDSRPLMLSGSVGSGRSSVLLRIHQGYQDDSDCSVLFHPGQTPAASGLRGMLRRVAQELDAAVGLKSDRRDKNAAGPRHLAALADQVPEGRKVVVLIDDADRLGILEESSLVTWLPRRLPPHFKLVLCCAEPSETAAAGGSLDRARLLRSLCIGCEVQLAPLGHESRTQVVEQAQSGLAEARRRERLACLLDHPAAGNLLFLHTALHGLFVDGISPQAEQQIATLPSGAIGLLRMLGLVLERWERLLGAEFARHALLSLALARSGLDLEEFAAFVGPAASSQLNQFIALARPFLHEVDGVFSIVSHALVVAVVQRYAPLAHDRANAHKELARYFAGQETWLVSGDGQRDREPNFRKTSELPWHWHQAGQRAELARCLCDPSFIGAKCVADSIEALEEDLERSWRACFRAGEQEKQGHTRDYVERLVKYAQLSNEPRSAGTHRLAPFPEPPRAVQPLLSPPDTNEEDRTRISACKTFLAAYRGLLATHAGHYGFVVQLAYDTEPEGPLKEAAESALAEIDPSFPLVLKHRMAEGLKGKDSRGQHEEYPDKFFLAADQQSAIATYVRSALVRVWDVETGRVRVECNAEETEVNWAAATPDSHRLVTVSSSRVLLGKQRDYAVRVWDLRTGMCLRELLGYPSSISAVALTPDGRWAVSGGVVKADFETDKRRTQYHEPIWIWDLESGQCVRKLAPPNSVGTVLVSPDSRLVLSDGKVEREYNDDRPEELFVWDFQTGHCLKQFQGVGRWCRNACITPDGRRIILGGSNSYRDKGQLHIVDLVAGNVCSLFGEHVAPISSIAITPDGRTVVTASGEGVARLWDLSSEQCIGMFPVHGYAPPLALRGTLLMAESKEYGVAFFKLINRERGPAIATAVRLYDHDRGCWTENVTASCGWCGRDFTVDRPLLTIVAEWEQTIDIGVPPTLALSDAAFADERLLTACERCGERIRLNPFLVDLGAGGPP